MGSSLRRSQRRDTSSEALSAFGNVLLVLATLAVAGLVAYLVLNPPGVLDPASQQAQLPAAPGSETAAVTTPPPVADPAPAPDPAQMPGQLSLSSSCAAVSPLLIRTDEIRKTAIDDSSALDSGAISDLTRELQTLSDLSPEELNVLIDTLTAVIVELNNEVLAGEENPQVDTEAADGNTEAIRALCAG